MFATLHCVTTQTSEADAWAEAREGSSRAFALLFDLYYDRVFRHIAGLADQRADADEICGAAFLELWRHRSRVRVVNGSVLPWLLVTASNLARNHGRKTMRYRQVLRALPRDPEPRDAAEIVEAREDGARRSASLRSAIAQLKPIDAQLLDLTGREGLPVQVAAEAVGITPGAARVRLHRARAQLRDRLGPDFEPCYSTREN